MAAEREQREGRDRNLALSQAFSVTRTMMQSGKLRPRGHFGVAPVPALENSLGPASPERQHRFRQHLDELLARWEAAKENPTPDQQQHLPESPGRDHELLLQACATCRGHCCLPGGTHAFLKLETIRRWFMENPDSDTDECREAYLSHLGKRSYENSCVFHGEWGCALPRDMRGDTCNTWFCPSLEKLGRERKGNPVAITVVVANAGGSARRINVVNSHSGKRLEKELEL
jgi:hypothetical protein